MLEDVENQVWWKIIVEEFLDLGIHKENIIFIDLDSLENKKIKTPDALEQLIKKLSVSQEKKYYLADLGFYYALNTNNQIENSDNSSFSIEEKIGVS